MRNTLFFVLLLTTTTCSRTRPTQFNWQAHVSTVLGNGAPQILSDPFGVATGADGTIYISDAGENNAIREISPAGNLSTLAGGDDSFNSPSGLAVDSAGNVYVADTGTNSIRKISKAGVVTTIAGTGTAGYMDGPANQARFDGPIGVALDQKGSVYVADTYNDRIRKISTNGEVTTIAGAGRPGLAEGDAANALFDTPCGVVVSSDGTLYIADTGNNAIRKITPSGQVASLTLSFSDDQKTSLRSPTGIALTADGFLYVTELSRATVVQIAPDGRATIIAGNGPGYSAGVGQLAHFNQPAGLAVDPRNGDVLVADGANFLVRRLSHTEGPPESNELFPILTPESLTIKNLLWPLDPQDRPHEVVATVGEVRGSFDSSDSRDHLHSGLDVSGALGEVVRAIRWEKVSSPLPNWGFDTLSEGLRIGVVSYIHMNVGRDKEGKILSDPRFVGVNSPEGKLARVRVRRGTRFQPGDALGTVNRMYHVHLIVGPPGAEINPLSLSPLGFSDRVAPTIERDGIQVFDEAGNRLANKQDGRLIVNGKVQIVVDAFDRTDMNGDRRRLGLYQLGYQVLKEPDKVGTGQLVPASADFNEPRITILFNRLPHSDEAPKIAYAADSGITVYGSKSTRFLYQVTNIVRDGHAERGSWDSRSLPKGNYVLRIIAADYSGNTAKEGTDLPITIR